ncbi:MAG: 30S ribosomal protein S4 [Acidobacteria bacterium]|nr:MAG: 30S ribosomal protein S4 [Acidobacteriota bacterium]REK02520.1 MAG: 30S ribosomal protein S4 [Acidobacteriota bacterium]REK13678.1 MAG: 30S ribosomal protein S4 [Acidobacteriota bacterium]REK41672.1 MAG: 30S ribosomal protein S4 [Acidobacteriota bacterium]
MARYKDAVCRLCRREGGKLFLKGDRCYKPSCAIEKRGTQAPGQHGPTARRRMLQGYGEQLREKQKVKRIYFVLEKQFRNYFQKASRQKGITGENLLFMLERRLDNAVFRSGFSTSRRQARQLVNHGHVMVNGRKVDIPSFQVKVGDEITIKDTTKKNPHVEGAWQTAVGRGRPPWITANDGEISAVVSDLPKRDDIDGNINEQLIVELYSK